MIELVRKWVELWTSCEDPEKSWSEGFIKHQQGSLTNLEGKAKFDPVSSEELPHKTLTSHNNSANHLCYVKISREQDLLLLIIEQHGDGLRSRSLNQGLEENKRLHEWLNLAKKNIPAAYKQLTEKKLQKETWSISLGEELAEKKKLATVCQADAKSNLQNVLEEKANDGTTEHHSTTDRSDCGHDFSPNSTAHLEEVTSPNYHPVISSMAPEHQADSNMLKSLDDSLLYARTFRRTVSSNYAWQPEPSIAFSQGISPEVAVLDSLYQTRAESQIHKPSSCLQQLKSMQGHSYPLIDLQGDTTNQGVGEPAPSFHPNQSTILSSCPQGHVDAFTQPALHIGNGCTLNSGSSFIHFQKQKQLLEQMQIRERGLYMHHTANNVEHFNDRHPIGHFSPIDQQGISSLQSPAVGDMMRQNWFPVERRAYDGWSGVHLPNVTD